jgi:hypothetical protein
MQQLRQLLLLLLQLRPLLPLRRGDHHRGHHRHHPRQNDSNAILNIAAMTGEEFADAYQVVPCLLLESAIGSLAEKAVISDDVGRSFIGLASRHRCVAVVRERCIDELREVFAALISKRFCSRVPHSHTAYIPAPPCVLWSTSSAYQPYRY